MTPRGYETILFGIIALLDQHPNWVVMQVDIKNVINNISKNVIFRKLQNDGGHLVSIIRFTKLFYGAHSFLYYQHGQCEEGVTIIESFLGTR